MFVYVNIIHIYSQIHVYVYIHMCMHVYINIDKVPTNKNCRLAPIL